MKPDDKTAEIDARPENVALARRALPVLVGVLCFPESVAQVRAVLGSWLDLPKRGADYRADAFTRTLWLACCELADADRPLHPVTIEQQAQAIAGRQARGLLGAWTPEHAQAFGEGRQKHGVDIGSASEVVLLAQDWAREAVKLCEIGPAAKRLAGALSAGEPVAIGSELARMQEMSARCGAAGAVPHDNLAALFDEWACDDTPDKLLSGFASLDALSGGLDIGLTHIVGRSNDGKTVVLQALALAQVFPQTTHYAHRQTPHERLVPNTADDRAYVLFLSAEMPRKEMLSRIACSLLLIDNSSISRDKARALEESTATFEEMQAAIREHGRLSLLDAELLGSLSPTVVCAAIESWATKIREADPGARLVAALDYLQFLDKDGDGETHEQVNAATRLLLNVAKSHRIAMLVGMQAADGPNPTGRGDIRAAKAVIDDAKSVLVIRRDRHDENRIDLYNDKARSGARGWTCELRIEGRYLLITDLPDGTATVGDPAFDADDPLAGLGVAIEAR